MKIIVTKKSKDGLAEVTFSKVENNIDATQAAVIGTELLDKAGHVLKNRARSIKECARRS